MSPLEILKERKIKLDHIRVFGCACFVHVKRNDKLDRNSVKTIFLGYSSEKKCYKCYDPTNHKLYISRDVSFLESKPYYKPNIPETNQPTMSPPNIFMFPEMTSQEQVENIEEEQVGEPISSGGEYERYSNEEPSQPTQEETRRRSTRQTRTPARLRDYVSHQVTYPIQKFICYEKVSPEYRVYLSNITSQTEPISFDEANLDPL
jgi:hypothetical protein